MEVRDEAGELTIRLFSLLPGQSSVNYLCWNPEVKVTHISHSHHRITLKKNPTKTATTQGGYQPSCCDSSANSILQNDGGHQVCRFRPGEGEAVWRLCYLSQTAIKSNPQPTEEIGHRNQAPRKVHPEGHCDSGGHRRQP